MKIALSGLFYPVSIMNYFRSALENREDVELVTVGAYTENWIPWQGGMWLPDKYSNPPTLPLSKNLISVGSMSSSFLHKQETFKDVDIWIECDAGFYFQDRPPCRTHVHIATDPHVLNYDVQRRKTDFFFNMQHVYKKDGDRYLPYAASNYHHFPEVEKEHDYDVCLMGLPYENRVQLFNALEKEGYSVNHGMCGMDEYRDAYNRSAVALSWSSKDDLIARVFEAGAMCIPLVTNRVTDLPTHFIEGEHYLGFDNLGEAVQKVKQALESYDDAERMAYAMYRKVKAQHTYDIRVNQILETIGAI